MSALTRQTILQALRTTFEPLPFVYAMWEGGAAAFNRVDEWSDIDLQVDVADDHADEILPLVEQTLTALSPIELQLRMPQSIWQLHAQVFYRLQNASPFLLLDFAILKHSTTEKYLETEIHGHHIIHFDKANVVRPSPIAPADWNRKLAERVETLRVMFPLFQVLTLKELRRGNSIEAFAFYQSYTVRPLVELLRIRHAPYHYNFHSRYIHYDLPPEIVQRLEALFYVAGPEQLEKQQQVAEAWFNEVIATIH